MKKKFRPEVQGLRAIMVLAVLVFHIWPEWLRVGYVGGDVFFVISGYLITGHLLREVETTNMGDRSKCGRDRAEALLDVDPIREAAAGDPRARLIDLTDEICTPTRCQPIVNGYLAWRDAHHMTATFASSLAPRLGEEIDRALATH